MSREDASAAPSDFAVSVMGVLSTLIWLTAGGLWWTNAFTEPLVTVAVAIATFVVIGMFAVRLFSRRPLSLPAQWCAASPVMATLLTIVLRSS